MSLPAGDSINSFEYNILGWSWKPILGRCDFEILFIYIFFFCLHSVKIHFTILIVTAIDNYCCYVHALTCSSNTFSQWSWKTPFNICRYCVVLHLKTINTMSEAPRNNKILIWWQKIKWLKERSCCLSHECLLRRWCLSLNVSILSQTNHT